MRRWFRFRGEATTLDLARVIEADVALRRFRDDLAVRHPPERAQSLTEDLLAAALHRFGDHVVTVKGGHLDRLITLRERLDGLYQSLLHSGDSGGRRGGQTQADFQRQLADVEGLYRELDATLESLSQPVHETPTPADAPNVLANDFRTQIEGVTPSTARQPRRPLTEDLTPDPGHGGRTRLQRKGIHAQPDGSYRVRFTDRTYADFTIEGGVYRVRTYDANGRVTADFREFDILHTPYRNKPQTTSVMNAHHGVQNHLMDATFGPFGYDGGAVPTIWLRDGRAGSPHGLVTDIQNSTRAARTGRPTYSQIREWCVADLRASNVPTARIQEYLTAMDSYMRNAVVPNLPANQRGRLGTWVP